MTYRIRKEVDISPMEKCTLFFVIMNYSVIFMFACCRHKSTAGRVNKNTVDIKGFHGCEDSSSFEL